MYIIHVSIHTGAMMGMMDAYEFDYDRMDDFIEELHDRVGKPPLVNLTDLANRGKVSSNRVLYRIFCQRGEIVASSNILKLGGLGACSPRKILKFTTASSGF